MAITADAKLEGEILGLLRAKRRADKLSRDGRGGNVSDWCAEQIAKLRRKRAAGRKR